MLTIAPRPMPDERDQLETQVERLRETLHEPHDEPMLEVTGPLPPLEWPDDPGVAPVGYPGRVDAAAAVEGPARIEEPVADDEFEEENEENGLEEDLEEDEESDLEEAEGALEDDEALADEGEAAELGEENGGENDLEAEEPREDDDEDDRDEENDLDGGQEDPDDELPPSLRFEDAG